MEFEDGHGFPLSKEFNTIIENGFRKKVSQVLQAHVNHILGLCSLNFHL
jgi:hypothetical protein